MGDVQTQRQREREREQQRRNKYKLEVAENISYQSGFTAVITQIDIQI